MSTDEIQSRQNEEKFLKIQYAARECYNAAEKLNNYAWVLCLLAAFSVFFPNSWPTFVSYGVPFVADIVALILIWIVNQKVKTAAKLRKYFDSYVLDITPNQFTETELRSMKEISGRIYSNNPQRAAIQMTNTGKDTPPGVFEWYVFSAPCSGISAKFECQRQNTWWNSKMFCKRLTVTTCAAVLVGIVFLLLMINNGILTIFLCSAGLIIKILERLNENGKYIKISDQIYGAQQAVEAHPTRESVEKLQSLIDERRAINVLELNWFHKKDAKALSEAYEGSVL